ncbi:MAG: MFS transporter, partial [Myxococcales bacterium]
MTATNSPAVLSPAAVRKVIFASSLGTVFEWYDFYIYATLAPFFATLFFPKGNASAALLASFATYAAGFLVRPFGALVFGRIGDLVGRKYTFLVTIMVMGLATAAVGLLPTYASIGMLSPTILVLLRLAQGLALGGEYGGAATYVAEHAPDNKRGLHTSWIQTTATLGFFVSLVVIAACRGNMDEAAFKEWGWRVPFLISLVLLVVSVYIRLKLNESPVFLEMKSQGKGSKAPLRDSFTNWKNLKIVLIALFGAAAGQGVVWYTGQFYALFFLTGTLKVKWQTAYFILAVALALGTGLFVFFGWLSDKIGRKKIMMAGMLLGALTYFPLYRAMTHYANPALESFAASTKVTVTATDCKMHLFPNPKTVYSDCDKVKDLLAKRSLSFETIEGTPGAKAITKINDVEIVGADEPKLIATLKALNYPTSAKPEDVNVPMLILIVFIQVIFVTMVYGPIAAFLVELFPARIRYTSMSLPYHIGNGWFGGM